MNPLTFDIVGSFVRAGLMFISGWLVEHHVWTPEQSASFSERLYVYILAALPGLVGLVWSAFTNYRKRVKLVTALSLPAGKTEEHLEQVVSKGNTPPVTLPKDQSAKESK